MVFCQHRNPNYLVLEFDWETLEGEYAIDLIICNGKYLSHYCCWKRDERWVEQYCWFSFSRNQQQQGDDLRYRKFQQLRRTHE